MTPQADFKTWLIFVQTWKLFNYEHFLFFLDYTKGYINP